MTKNRTPTPVYLDPGMHPGLEVKGLTRVIDFRWFLSQFSTIFHYILHALCSSQAAILTHWTTECIEKIMNTKTFSSRIFWWSSGCWAHSITSCLSEHGELFFGEYTQWWIYSAVQNTCMPIHQSPLPHAASSVWSVLPIKLVDPALGVCLY